ncbi:unnamed protein product (macronuclear) [Paramecium tetraurelia]|uniref:Uncharacterized protein n=1 Tax=Paramecium tetraurelia TaxID=5888 RepID=A0CQ47_PARTE|nr:uncharacterized protein GSPATT00009262001 [Paramecium tetraurelia]CAK72914.1 unnamed protein product [Paramecium tetraurelia]|eukprot:XP_001440311.1 hypothetical protein (macronuclear) [Paramecium tetraurelia strain d4-2]
MINIITFSKQLEFTNIEEVSESVPRFFIATLGINNTQMIEKKNQTNQKVNQILRQPKDIKVFLIQNTELNQYTLFTILKVENFYLDLINFITNLIMSITDGFIFAITQSGIESLEKLKRKICIKNHNYSLSQLISDEFSDKISEQDCETLLLLEQQIDSSEQLDFKTFISSSLKTFKMLIVIISESCQSLKDLSLETAHAQFPSELVQFLQKLKNL